METITEASKHHRELTKTEIKIAIAQIEDRLYRVLKATEILWAYLMNPEQSGLSETDQKKADEHFKKSIRIKYDIPEGVTLLPEECNVNYARNIKEWIPRWVSGSLSEDCVRHEIVDMSLDMYEFDYGWVFLERPMYFYDRKNPKSPIDDEIHDELVQIGTRSKRKWPGLRKWTKEFHAK